MSTMKQPNTETLRRQYGIRPETELAVIEARDQLSYAIGHHQDYFISVDGTCALTDEPRTIAKEAHQKAAAASESEHYIGLNRSLCFHKERTDPKAWRGVDTTEREAAYRIIADQAKEHANGAAEIGTLEQLKRYGLMLTFGWIGGRAVENTELIKGIALQDPSLPLGIKNGLDGRIDSAIQQIELVEAVRGGEGAPAVLIYRGGDNAKTPKASKEACKRVIERTNGRVIIDTAHGVEMAHDPDPAGNFAKSVAGQIAANEMLQELAQEGYLPLGKMSEASAQKSPTDPNMPLAIALEASRALYEIKRSGLLVPVRRRKSQLY